MLCPSCATPLPQGARFCPSCGHAVMSAQPEERRIVTVLFGDLVGFTGLSETLDPEQVKRFIDAAFEQLVDDVTSFGGRVDKIMGDGILALFGAPVAHEDDAERAVRAALKMQQTLAEHLHDTTFAPPAQMRIGINTGEVLVGTLAGTDYTAMGDVVNIASRLQSAAPIGGILVGASTYALTSSAIRYDSPAALLPRGREQSIDTWLAVETVTAPGARNRRADLRLVGRSGEVELGSSALQLAMQNSHSLLINVLGESGIGKTRLVAEWLGRFGDEVMVLEGACAPYGQTNVWWPLASALGARLGLDSGQDAASVRAESIAVTAKLYQLDPEDQVVSRTVEVFMYLLGHPSSMDKTDPAQVRSSVHRTVANVIERCCVQGPVVLSIDDLHWADDVVLDLLEHLAGSFSRLPFVLVTAMRPGSEVAWPPASERTTVLSIVLQPLGRVQSDQLSTEMLAEAIPGVAGDARLLGVLYDRSGGNPLFLQELAGVAAKGGHIGDLPDSLRALIAARLDQLTTEQRQLLDNAATLGISGAIASLEKFADALGQVWRRSVLIELDAAGMIEIHGDRWAFRSDSVREAAYRMLTKAGRARRHAGVAATMALDSPMFLDDLAHHSATAAELVGELGELAGVPRTIRADAIRYLASACERARATGSHRLVVRHATRALDLMGDVSADSALRTKLRLLRADGLIELRDYGQAQADLSIVLADAAGRSDIETEGEARRLLGSLFHLEGNQDAARVELGRSVELLRTAGALPLLAGALRQRGFIELFGGSRLEAEWFFGEADAVYREIGDERGSALVEQHRAWLSFLAGDLEVAEQRLAHAAATLERLGDRNGVGWAYGLLAFVRFFQRRFDEAESLAMMVRSEAVERGDDWAAAMMLTLVADLRLWQGQLDEAVTMAEQARAKFRKINDKFGLVQSLGPLLRAQVALGRSAAADRTSEELMAFFETALQGPLPGLAVAGAAMHRGDGLTAVSTAERTITLMVDARTNAYEAHVVHAIGLAQLGRLDDALSALTRVEPDQWAHPFPNVAAAVVHSLIGDAEIALGHVAAVTSAEGATYLDRALTALGGAIAHVSLGHRESARLMLENSISECLRIGDVIATALGQRAYARLLGEPHPSGEGDASVLGEGWRSLIGALPMVAV